MSTAGHLKTIRQGNVRTIIEALAADGPMSRADLCEETGLSRTTMHRILRDLMAEQAVVETFPSDRTTPGRPQGLLSVNPDVGVVVGMELGRSHVAAVLLNYAGTAVWGRNLRLERPLGWNDGVVALLEMVEELLAAREDASGALKLGVVGLHGLMPSSVNYPGSDVRDRRVGELRKALISRFGVPIEVHSNARLAAVAEFRGLSLSDEDLIYCHLSRGIGAAIILGGQVLPGSTNSAGEFGHMQLLADGQACHCGGRGCVETVVGLDSLMERARKLEPELTDFSHLCEAISGSVDLKNLAIETAFALGNAIGNMCNVVNPEYVVLGGELVDLLPDWVAQVNVGVNQTALQQVREGLHLSTSVHRQLAAAQGAGLLALDIVLGRVQNNRGEENE